VIPISPGAACTSTAIPPASGVPAVGSARPLVAGAARTIGQLLLLPLAYRVAQSPTKQGYPSFFSIPPSIAATVHKTKIRDKGVWLPV